MKQSSPPCGCQCGGNGTFHVNNAHFLYPTQPLKLVQEMRSRSLIVRFDSDRHLLFILTALSFPLLFFPPPAFSLLLSFCILSFTLNLLVNTSRDVNEERWCWLLGRWSDKQNDLWCRDMGQFDAGKLNFIFFFIFLSKTHFYWCHPSCHIGV